MASWIFFRIGLTIPLRNVPMSTVTLLKLTMGALPKVQLRLKSVLIEGKLLAFRRPDRRLNAS